MPSPFGGGFRTTPTKIHQCGGTCTPHAGGLFKKFTLKTFRNNTTTPTSSVKTVSLIGSFVLAGVVGLVAAIF